MPNEIVDTFNVENQDYHFDAPMDNLPVEGSKKAVMSGGVWQEIRKESILQNEQLQDLVFGDRYARKWSPGAWDTQIGHIQSIIFAKDLYIANATYNTDEKPGGIWWSEDGVHWVHVTNAVLEARFLAYANGLFVACGAVHYIETAIWWSEDGKNWYQGTIDTTPTGSFRFPVFVNGLWFCSNVYDKGLWWSEDGKNWTMATGVSDEWFYEVQYADGIWVCPSDHGFWWSEDGKTWTQGTGFTARFNGALSHDDGVWVFLGQSSSTGAWYSEDGKAWSQCTGFDSNAYSGKAVRANGIWVCARRISTASNSKVYYSYSGKAWVQCTGFDSGGFASDPFYAAGLWLLGHNTGVYWSSDGKTWTKGGTNVIIGRFAYTNGLWVGYVSGGNYGLAWSTDAASWSAVPETRGLAMTYPMFLHGKWLCGTDYDGIWNGSGFDDLFNVGTPAP